jgi:hypothetical protein
LPFEAPIFRRPGGTNTACFYEYKSGRPVFDNRVYRIFSLARSAALRASRWREEGLWGIDKNAKIAKECQK